MEYNNPSEIVKDLNFGDKAKEKLMLGIGKLSDAVGSTLGASGRCVIYEDTLGKPVITKDGVTVAESVVLLDPVENIGATLIKEAAKSSIVSLLVEPKPGKSIILTLILPLTLFIINADIGCFSTCATINKER